MEIIGNSKTWLSGAFESPEPSEDATVTCPCCGFVTIRHEHDICRLCGWQHDPAQLRYPGLTGANAVGLAEAQRAGALRSGEFDRGGYPKDPLCRPLDDGDGLWTESPDVEDLSCWQIATDETAWRPCWLSRAKA